MYLQKSLPALAIHNSVAERAAGRLTIPLVPEQYKQAGHWNPPFVPLDCDINNPGQCLFAGPHPCPTLPRPSLSPRSNSPTAFKAHRNATSLLKLFLVAQHWAFHITCLPAGLLTSNQSHTPLIFKAFCSILLCFIDTKSHIFLSC